MNYPYKKGPKLFSKFRPVSIIKNYSLFKINDIRDFQIALFKCCTFIFLVLLVTYIIFNDINN
jgi:hypothetical protein